MFVKSVGPKLSNQWPRNNTREAVYDYQLRTPSSVFLRAVEEKLDIVRKCEKKTSTDYNEMDITVVKNIPVWYCKMKMEKVISLYKVGDRHHSTHYRPVSLFSQYWKNSLLKG